MVSRRRLPPTLPPFAPSLRRYSRTSPGSLFATLMLLFQFPPELLLPVRRQFSSSAFSSATCRSNHSRSFFGAGFFFALPSARLLPRFLAARVYAAALIDMNGDLAFE